MAVRLRGLTPVSHLTRKACKGDTVIAGLVVVRVLTVVVVVAVVVVVVMVMVVEVVILLFWCWLR